MRAHELWDELQLRYDGPIPAEQMARLRALQDFERGHGQSAPSRREIVELEVSQARAAVRRHISDIRGWKAAWAASVDPSGGDEYIATRKGDLARAWRTYRCRQAELQMLRAADRCAARCADFTEQLRRAAA